METEKPRSRDARTRMLLAERDIFDPEITKTLKERGDELITPEYALAMFGLGIKEDCLDELHTVVREGNHILFLNQSNQDDQSMVFRCADIEKFIQIALGESFRIAFMLQEPSDEVKSVILQNPVAVLSQLDQEKRAKDWQK